MFTIMKMHRRLNTFLAAALLALLGSTAHSASVYLNPSDLTANLSDGTATFELFMDFTGTPTVGGGVDFSLSGPISGLSFAPSVFFQTVADAAFTGFGTALADGDLEIHFGSFTGLSGLNKLGDLTVTLNGLGAAAIAVSINSTFGAFFPTTGVDPLPVELLGAQLTVVPLPAAGWLLLTGVGGLAAFRRWSSARAC